MMTTIETIILMTDDKPWLLTFENNTENVWDYLGAQYIAISVHYQSVGWWIISLPLIIPLYWLVQPLLT